MNALGYVSKIRLRETRLHYGRVGQGIVGASCPQQTDPRTGRHVADRLPDCLQCVGGEADARRDARRDAEVGRASKVGANAALSNISANERHAWRSWQGSGRLRVHGIVHGKTSSGVGIGLGVVAGRLLVRVGS